MRDGLDRARAKLARDWPAAVLALVVLGSVYQAFCHAEVFVDDAAITFAYSRQLAETGEVVHTASSERVEGFSNPTWMALGALAVLLRMDPYIFARALGLLFLVASILLVYRVARLLCPRSRAAPLLAPLLLGMAPCVPYWTVAGLETPLVSFLLVLAFHQSLREELEGAPPRVGIVLAALALSRPEGVLYAAPVVGYKVLRWRLPAPGRPPASRRRAHLANLVAFGAPLAAYLLWRRLYFSAWLPNTYHAKVGDLALVALEARDRWRPYLTEFLRSYHLWPVVFASPLALAVRGRAAEAALVLATVALHLAFVVRVNADWMGDFRFFAMVMPAWALLVAMVAMGLGDLVSAGRRLWLARRPGPEPEAGSKAGRLAAAAGSLAFVFFGLVPTLGEYGRAGWVQVQLVRGQGLTLELLAREIGLARASIAVPDAGGSALTPNVHVLDTVGLTDRVVARWKTRPDAIQRYFLEEARPDFYQQHSVWRAWYNFPLQREFRRDYVQIPAERARRLMLLGDNFVRREHLTGYRAEMDHAARVELGSGLTLVGYDDPLVLGEATVLRLLVATDGSRPPPGARLEVSFSGPGGRAVEASPLELDSLPHDLFEPGALLRLRVFGRTGSADSFVVTGPAGQASGPLLARSVRAGSRPGAELDRHVVFPRTHLVCPQPPPLRRAKTLRAEGRIQRFAGCRPVHPEPEVRALARELVERASATLAAGEVRPAIGLLGRAELLLPTSAEIERARRRAARQAYGEARRAADDGRLDEARALLVAALEADPLLSRARTLYLELLERGLPHSPDARERAEAARARLERDAGPAALREALEALVEADRPLEAVRLLEERGEAVGDAGARALAAEAYLAVGLCDRALELLDGAAEGCRADWLAALARRGCGRQGRAPGCPRPGPRPSPFELLEGFEQGAPPASWEASEPLDGPTVDPPAYVSGSVGAGLLRTDRAASGRYRASSPELVLLRPALSLQVGGSRREDGVGVSLVVDGRPVRVAGGAGDAHLRRVTWDVSDLVGRRARLEVVDASPGGFLMVDHVRAHALYLFEPAMAPSE